MSRLGRRTALFALLITLCCGFALAEDALPLLQLHQPNIGCANCHLLIAGDTVILVDGGTDTDSRRKPDDMFAYVAATGIDHIDAHFVTHYHNDHAQQLDDFSQLYGTETTVVYGPSEGLPERFLPLPNGSYQQFRVGDEVDVGPFHIQCVGPEEVAAKGEINRDSIDFVVTYGDIRILFTGDYMDRTVRQNHAGAITNVDIFIFPHHGLSPFCVDAASLKILNPSLVLVPGNTAGNVRKYFNSNGVKPLVRSPYYGNLVVLSDGHTFELHEDVALGAYASLR